MNKKLSDEEIIKKAKELKPNYTIINVYRKVRENSNSKKLKIDIWLKVKCDKGHAPYDVTWDNFKKSGCSICHKEKEPILKYSKEDVIKILKEHDLEMIEDNYKNASSNLRLRCLKCGNISIKNIKQIIDGRGCRKCLGLSKKTTEVYSKEVYELVGDEYTVLSSYTNAKNYIIMKHNICGCVWRTTPHNFLGNIGSKGRRCPRCNQTHGEKEIENLLKKYNIDYSFQYSFNDLKDKEPLRFDFAIFEDKKKNKLKMLIEYQGIQHYEPVDFAGKGEEWAKNSFNITKEHDNLKKEYCKCNDIKLLEISYWEYNDINNILYNLLIK